MSQIPVPAGLQEDSLEHTIEILAKQFNDDAFQRYILLDELQGSEKTDIGVELNQEVFGFVVPDFLKGGARMITIPGSGVASVWQLEEITETYVPEPHNPPAVNELNSLAHHARQRALPSQATHMLHLVLLANDRTHPSATTPAKVSDLIRPVLDMAKEKGWPVVLESTSPRSRDVYAHSVQETAGIVSRYKLTTPTTTRLMRPACEASKQASDAPAPQTSILSRNQKALQLPPEV